jgi:hypothetical protein
MNLFQPSLVTTFMEIEFLGCIGQDFIKDVKAKADGDPKTIEGYRRSLRAVCSPQN